MPAVEQPEIRALARDFAAGEIRPHAARRDAERGFESDLFEKVAEVGFLGMLVPEGHGGLDFDLATYLLVLEELGRADAAVALSVAMHSAVAAAVAEVGDEERKAAWLPRLAGGTMAAFASAHGELGGPVGDGVGAAACRARRSDGGWMVSGSEAWVTDGASARLVLVLARMEEGEGGAGVGGFVVEPPADGYRPGPPIRTMGLRASESVAVEMEDVPARRLEAEGADAEAGVPGGAGRALDLARLGVAAVAVGIAAEAVERASAYALEREQFGTPIAGFGGIREKLGRMATGLAAARALTWRAAAVVEAGRRRAEAPGEDQSLALARATVAGAKIAASEAAMRNSDEAVQIFGGYGFMRDYPVEKLMRDAKGTEICGGTNEMLRDLIAHEVLDGARARSGSGARSRRTT